MYVENLCNIVENYHIDPCTYDDLNVLRSCDLSEHSITTAQICQGGGDKNSHTEPRKNMSVSYKYWLEDWQYRSGILY